MDVQPSRLRLGEALAGAASLVLAALLFGVGWYGLAGVAGRTVSSMGVSASVSGWHALPTLRWLILVTIVVGLALAYFQAARAAPALPVSLSVIVTFLAIVTAVCLIYRVLISVPGPDSLFEAKAGAYLALACSMVLIYAGVRSMREESRPDSDVAAAIPTVDLDPRH
jgi:Mn2+/Fe2+ NRAMP family transporter